VNVVAIGDAAFGSLRPDLRAAVSEYVQLPKLHDYDSLLRATAALTSRHGKLDRIESLNEHWLPVEARLREDFNVVGLRPATLHRLQRKSDMAEVFRAARIPAPALECVESPEQVWRFAHRHGMPLVLKPNKGVGGAGAFKVKTHEQLDEVLRHPLEGMVVQPFVPGRITTFDGLTDASGRILFTTSFVYSSGIMEVLTEGLDIFYFTRLDIPAGLDEVGRRAVDAFELRERFFHLEFFELPDGRYQALEINVRPPGGFSTDMMNWSCDMDLYAVWAAMLAGEPVEPLHPAQRFITAHIARRRSRRYRVPHHELLSILGATVLDYRELYPPVSDAMGELVYLVRTPTESEFEAAVELIAGVA
jgi:hypothetical protein